MISFSRYINIISGVGAGASVRNRELILRIITNNTKLPPGIIAEFSNPDSVMAYFGSSSEEYARAVRYFGFVSKSIRSPRKISFSRMVESAIAPMIVGDATPKTLAPWLSVTAGTLTLVVSGTEVPIAAIDTSTATDLTNVASIVQTAIRAQVNPMLATATVTYNTVTEQFVFTGATTGSGEVHAKAGNGTNIAGNLGWTTSGAVNVPGQAADTPVESASKSAALSSNFGSFLYVPYIDPNSPTNVTSIAAVAEWNDAQNNKYMFLQPSKSAYIADLYTACKGFGGMGVTVIPSSMSNDFADQCPAEIMAATDYESVNGVQGYMYYVFDNREITVDDDALADLCDVNRANYNGATETGGQKLAFYQRGVLMGGTTDAVDMNVYANEAWLKDDIGVRIMSLQLSSPDVPANKLGRGMLLGTITTSIEAGRSNGVISAGKTLDNTQKQYISQVTGNPNAWRQVQDTGSYVDLWFTTQTTSDGRQEKVANYTLVYSKSDSVRKVNGSNIMI